jgi:colicin import membrane protein
VGLALLLHALLLAAAVYGWMLFRSPPHPVPTLAIEATVVDARTVAGAQRPTPPQPSPPAPAVPQETPPEPQGPPPPTPEERAERERQKSEAAAAQQAAEEKAEQQAAQAKAAAESRKADEERAAEAKRKAAEAKAAQEKKAQEAAQAKEKAAEAQEAAEREADLKRSLASEEHAAAASTGPALASWTAQITAKIERNWQRPPTARAGIQCMLDVTQEPGGTVTQVKVLDCNGDQAVRESIERAVYRASPLPAPPDLRLFDRNLRINFKPAD